jgi:hypothetical protein
MSRRSPSDPSGSRELVAIVAGGLLVLVCCAGPALLAAGVLGAAGGVLRNGFLVGGSDCLPEAQALGQLQRQLGDRVVILAVDADPADLESQTRAFFHTAGDPGYAVARDQNGRLAGAFAVRALDTTVVVDPKGRVVYRDEVPTDLGTLRTALAKAGRS